MQVLLPLFAIVLLVVVLLGGVALLLLLFQVMKQQGRLLIRLDAFDERVAQLASARPQPPKPAPVGLAEGEQFPTFKLPDLKAKEVALEDFLGRKVLLVNWSPRCGYCVRIAPELARLHRAYSSGDFKLVLASYGDAEANSKLAEEHGLEDTILLRNGAPAIEPFENFGTPSAYLLDEEGRVAKAVVIGADRVPILGRFAAGEASEAELAASAQAKKSTCGQNAKQIPAPGEISGSGPGTELKKMLAKMGISVTADCPCNERAAIMDRNGWAWCKENLETIVGWLREESARRGMVFIEFGGRFLVNRAIAKAQRSDGKSKNSAAHIIPDPTTRRTA